MGAEYWEYTAPFEADTPDVKAVLFKHKLNILPLTPDWDNISITDSEVPEVFTVAPCPEGVDEDFFEEIERGTGYYEISYNGTKAKSVHFFGYSCD